MIAFRGILNDDGIENQIRIYLDFEAMTSYTTDFYIDNARSDAIIKKDTCIIQNIEYQYIIKQFKDEIIMAAKEVQNIFHCLFPCVHKQRFFVVSNKDEV